MNNVNEFIGIIEKARTEGKDINELLNDVNAMQTNGTTKNIGLNQWKPQDKPSMEDFNRDNEIIDREIVELKEGKADSTTLNTKADKTAVDGKVTAKADKSTTYTK